jgi:regulatory protein
LDRRALHRKALDLLARREHAVAELRQKLEAKGYASDTVQELVRELQDEGLVSDERFTEAFVRYRMNRGDGPLRIQSKLRECGVDEMTRARYLDFHDPRWLEQIKQARRKRFGAGLPGDYQERARQARFLQYRGFTTEQIRQTLDGGGFD